MQKMKLDIGIIKWRLVVQVVKVSVLEKLLFSLAEIAPGLNNNEYL